MYKSRSYSRLKRIEAKLFTTDLSSWINLIEEEETIIASMCPMNTIPKLSDEEKQKKATKLQREYGSIKNYRNRPIPPTSPEIEEMIEKMMAKRRKEMPSKASYE